MKKFYVIFTLFFTLSVANAQTHNATVNNLADQEIFLPKDAYIITTNGVLQTNTTKTPDYKSNKGQVPKISNLIEEGSSSVSVFPNPTKLNWTISTTNTIINSVEIYNLLGKRVFAIKNTDNTITISASRFLSGIYLAKINTNAGVSNLKLIKD